MRKNGDRRLGDDGDPPVVGLLRAIHAGRLLQLLRGQRRALQLHPAAASEPRAQGDAAGDPLHPRAAAPPAAARLHQTQRRPDVHAGPVQHHLCRPGAARVLLLQARSASPDVPDGDRAGEPLPG